MASTSRVITDTHGNLQWISPILEPDLSQLRLGWCLWIVLVLVRAFWVCRVGH